MTLTVAVEVGLLAACLTFIYRISSLTRAEEVTAAQHPVLQGHEARVQAHRLYGALFFGAVKLVESMEGGVDLSAHHDDFLAAVADKSNQPVYIRCGSANRVGGMWMVKRVLQDKWAIDRATTEAEAIGLTSPDLKKFVASYIAVLHHLHQVHHLAHAKVTASMCI